MTNNIFHTLTKIAQLICFCLLISDALADNLPISLFPIEHYDQNINNWIKQQVQIIIVL